ncbi:MAG: hypothetical protein U1F43_17850 [Myxococcota bacterium]
MSLMALVLALAVSADGPQPPGPALERARLCWAAVDADCAEAALVEVRKALDQLPAAEAQDALRLSAEVALSSDRPADARSHIQAALERDPRWAPAWPPAWLAVVDEVRKILPDRLPPELEPDLPPTATPKKALRVFVHARDPSGVASVTVTAGADTFVCLTADGELWQVELPREMVKMPDLSLTIVAVDRAGNAATLTRVVPVALPPKPPEVATPVTSRWWFWVAVGAGVAAVTTGVVLLAGGGSAGPATSKEGVIAVDVEFAP